jgi:hypothetical protein
MLAIVGTGFFQRGIALESLLSAVILLIPTLCMGILFPLLLDFAATRRSPVKPGLLVGANTLGSVVAPLFIGFFCYHMRAFSTACCWRRDFAQFWL